MRIGKFRISQHAAKRMAQRNVDVGEVAIALHFGRKEHREGVEFFILGERDLPEGQERVLKRLVGLTVVAIDECILTVYRNAKSLSRIKRKLKWHWSKANPGESTGTVLI